MELHAIEGFSAPPGGVAGSVTTSDRVTLRFARWPARGRGRGTVVVLSGRSESIERYYEVVADLLQRGFAVATFDWRGQGASDRALRDRRKGHVRSFAEYDRDLDAVLKDVVLPDCPPPYFGLAHSMGGLIALRGARGGRVPFARLVLSAPMIGFGLTRPAQSTACRIAAAITRLGFGSVSAHGAARHTIERVGFDDNQVTGDRARFERNRTIATALPQLFVSGPTYGWINAACRAMSEAAEPKFAAAIRLPTLVVAGSRETVVSLRAIERLAAGMKAGSAVIIPGGKHELLMERDGIRRQFWAAFDAFVPGS